MAICVTMSAGGGRCCSVTIFKVQLSSTNVLARLSCQLQDVSLRREEDNVWLVTTLQELRNDQTKHTFPSAEDGVKP